MLDPIAHHLLRELQSRDHEIFDPFIYTMVSPIFPVRHTRIPLPSLFLKALPK